MDLHLADRRLILRASAVVLTLAVIVLLFAAAQTASADGPGGVPDTPNGLEASAVHAGIVDIKWNEVEGAESYEVRVMPSGTWISLPGEGMEIAHYGAGAIVRNLPHEGRYYFSVRARNESGASEWSAFLFVQATGTPSEWSGVPEPVNAAATGTPSIVGRLSVGETLTADTSGIADANGLERVRFRYQWTSSDGTADTDIEGATSASYTLVSADEGSAIRVRVSFTDRGGYEEGPLTGVATPEVGPELEVPSAPRNLSVAPAENGELTLSWEPPDSDGGARVTGYRVEWKSDDEDYGPPRQADVDSLSHRITGLTNGSDYRLRVLAVNRKGEGPASDEVTGSPQDTTPPELLAADVRGTKITLTYNKTLDADSVPTGEAFGVTVNDDPRQVSDVSAEGSLVKLDLASAVRWNDTATVSYTPPSDLRAPRIKDTWGNSAGSFSEALTPPLEVPGPPRNLSARGENGELELSWDAPDSNGGSQVGGYRVQWKSGYEDYDPTRQTEVEHPPYTATGLTDGVEYTLRVMASNETGEGPASAEVTASPQDTIDPELLTVAIHDATLRLHFSEALAAGSAPSEDAFNVVVSGAAQQVTNVSVEGRTLELTLASSASSSDTVALSYTAPADPAAARIEDLSGNPAAARIEDLSGNPAASFGETAAVWSDIPGPPMNLRAYPGESGVLTALWEAPTSNGGSQVREYRLQWKSRDEDYDPSREAEVTGGRERSITGLANGVEYALRVFAINSAGHGPSSLEVARKPRESNGPLYRYTEEEVVERYEGGSPWLRRTWEYMQSDEFELRVSSEGEYQFQGAAWEVCWVVLSGGSDNELAKCRGRNMILQEPYTRSIGLILHEMGHVYTYTNAIHSYPGPEAIAWLYFDHPQFCAPSELYADALVGTVYSAAGETNRHWWGYWDACSHYPNAERAPTPQAALAEMQLALNGEYPEWLHDTYADEQGNLDLVGLWNQVQRFGRFRDVVSYGLRNEFGGYCSNHWVRLDLLLGYHDQLNPWSAGGCLPGAPRDVNVVAGDRQVIVKWEEPLQEGALPISHYRIQWKELGADYYSLYDLHRPNELAREATISRLSNGVTYKVRVAAAHPNLNVGVQRSGIGAWVELTVTPGVNSRATGSPAISGIAQTGQTLTVDTSGIVDADRLTNVSYSYQWIRRDGTTDTDIQGATSSTYTLSDADEGKTISVRLSFTDDAGHAETLTSAATTAVAAKPNSSATGAPAISGTAQVGETLTADVSGVTDADGLTNASFSYQWIRNDGTMDTDIKDATESTYTLDADDKGKTVKVRVSFTDDTGNGETLTSAATVPVAAKPNSPATGAPVINGTAQVDETLTADVFGISDADGLTNVSYSYQWVRNDNGADIDIAGETDSTYTLVFADQGKTIKVRVSFTDDGGNEETLTSAATAEIAARPNTPATGAPTISGTAQVGETLTAETSGISDADGLDGVSYSYQWIAGGSGIDGVTGSSHTLTTSEQGQAVQVRVSFTDDAGNPESLTSEATAAVGARPNTPATGLPTISGTAQVGETLTAETSGIADEDGLNDAVFAYQWLADDANIQGAANSTYTLADSDDGKAIKVKVSFTDDRGYQETLTSAATAAVASRSDKPVADEEAPVWSADMLVVEYTPFSIGAASADLFSNVGGSAGLHIKSLWSYTLNRDLRLAFEESVPGAADLTLQVGDLKLPFPAGSSGQSSFKWTDVDVDWEDGQTISVRIVPTSATVTPQPNTPATGAPTITGAAQVDETLTADVSSIADSDGLTNVSYRYQWIRNDGNADADIAGETASTYTPVSADVGKTIKVKVSFTDDDDNEEALTSVATVAVASAPNREATGQPTIDGTPQVRETLTADTANIADQDGLTGVSYRYQWIAGGSDIDGATSSTYILTASEHGQTIQVRVSFTDDRNNAETLTSAATVAVAAKPNTAATGEPTISGTAQVGETLTADTSGISDADGLTSVSHRYQWIAGGSDISGATGSSRLLTASQQGQTVQVKVTFTDDADNQESLTSAETLAVAARPNTSATGEPAISGAPQVEATLTADTSAISDEDGLANVSYQYQWLRDDADIAGQTNSTYRLVSADQGKTIRVRVAFADDRGNEETITSEPTTTVAPSNPQPEVAPRLQEWAGGSGNFALSASSRIVVSAGDGSKHFSDDFFSTVLAGRTDPEQSGLGETQRSAARLALADSLNATAYHTASRRTLDQVAAKIRDDIEDLTGLSLAVITASASISPQAGDVVVDVLDASSYTVAAEGYELAIGDWATIRANSTSGVFYGSRTLLQILAQSGNNTAPRGTARDYPTLGHRLIHLDMNRKYWEMDYLADSFRRMSWVKLNAFKIHFADANGWRLHDPGTAAWSGTMPAAPAPDTAAEVLGSVSLGAPTGVKVLPGAGSLTVQWDPPNDQTDQDVRSYRVQIRRQGDLAWSPADYRDSAGTGTAYLTMTDRSHNFGGLTDGVTYEVRVSADTGFPGLADSKEQYQSGDKKWFYDREDIRLLEAWAAENHISIMPGFEFPGHTSVINNLYETGFADGGSDRCGNAHVYGNVKPGFVLDTTSSRAVAQAKTIMEHFMPWFSGPYVHIGGEEVSPKLANCPRVAAHIRASSSVSSLGDMLTVFFNDLNQLVREMDKSMIIYNGVEHLGPDTNVAQLDSTVVVMDWNAGSYNYYGGAPGSTGARHKFMKMRASDGYYLTSNNFHALYPEESRLYDKWVVEPAETYLGAAIGVWLDYIYWSQDEYTELLLQRPRAILGDRTWNGSATPDTVDEFYARVQAIGEPPAYQGFTKRTRVNDGLPSHHYGFEDDTEVFPPTHFKNLRHGRIHLLRDEAGELHATSYNVTSPSVRDDDKKFGASSWEFSKGGHGAGIGGVDIPAPWTMSIWVKRTADRVGAALMSSRSPTGDHRYIRLQRSGTQVGIDDRNGLGCSFDYSTPLNEWTHLAFVADTATITLYVDGAPQSATCASLPLPMGAISARGNDSLRAYLDELKIWDETLSRAQVERLAVSEAASLPGPLTGFTVVNASDQTTVEQLAEGATLTLDDPASGSYRIQVDTDSTAQIGSVRLELSGKKTVSRTDNASPYSLGGDGALPGESLPAGSYTLRATAYAEQDLGGDVLGTLEVSFTVTVANSPATGAPSIDGTAQSGATLTADTSEIADADGLNEVSYAYQWKSNDGTGDTDIEDATTLTYELSDEDVGKTVTVRVSFTDDADNPETLTSEPTPEVAAAEEPTPDDSPTWSATLTVGTEGTNSGYSAFNRMGNLSIKNFQVEDENHTVASLYQHDGSHLDFVLRHPMTTPFILTIKDIQFDSQSASTVKSNVAFIYSWPKGDLEWSDGQDVKSTLVLTESTETTEPAAPPSAPAPPNTPATGLPTISGTPQVGKTLTADTSGIADADGLDSVSYNYQWMADNANIQHVTGSSHTLTGDDGGKAIKVKVSFTDDTGNAETLTSQATTAVAPRPNRHAAGAPSIQGVLQDQQVLTADTVGIIDADGLADATFSYQWMRITDGDSSEITGQTSSTYTLTTSDVGNSIQLKVAFTDDREHEESLTSAATPPVAASGATWELLWLSTMTPEDPNGLDTDFQFSSSADEGSLSPAAFTDGEDTRAITFLGASFDSDATLALELDFEPTTAQIATWRLALHDTELAFADAIITQTDNSPPSYRYQWDVTALAVDDSDLWDDEEAFTVSLLEAINLPATGVPTISGTPQVNETLSAAFTGIIDGNGLDHVSYEYQWIAGGSDIDGATGSSFTLTSSQEGQTIQVQVNFEDDDGFSETATSIATDTVAAAEQANSLAEGLPIISGTPRVDQTLTADTSAIADEDGLSNVSYRYQWIASGTDIEGATGSSYELTSSEQGQAIQVRVSFTDDRNNAETLTSEATVAVAAAPNRDATGAPTIGGTPQVDQTLTADTSPIDDGDGLTNVSYRYQWMANDGTTDTEIDDATDSTYTLVFADQGKTIKVKVSFTDDADNDESLTSVATVAIAAAPNREATGKPAIGGMPQVGQTLTADPSNISDLDGITKATFAYQWRGGGLTIIGANRSTYTLTASDQGKTITVRVTFTDDRNSIESRTSNATTAVAAAPNRQATGQPTIGGTPQVDLTLTADTSPIDDEDGLTNVSYRYQWVAGGSDIDGATSSTYTLAASEQGQTIQVKVTFTDDRNNAETLTSIATAEVAAAPEPLIVRLKVAAPTSHDGSSEFTFEIEFSEEFGLSYVTLKSHAFNVTGGSVEKAQRTDKPSNIPWRITVKPQGAGDVTIELPATTDCGAAGAICTGDGRKLSNSLNFTVSGPGQ